MNDLRVSHKAARRRALENTGRSNASLEANAAVIRAFLIWARKNPEAWVRVGHPHAGYECDHDDVNECTLTDLIVFLAEIRE